MFVHKYRMIAFRVKVICGHHDVIILAISDNDESSIRKENVFLPVRDAVLVQEDQSLQSVSTASDTVQCGPLGYLKQLAYAFEHTFHCVYLGHIDTTQQWHD